MISYDLGEHKFNFRSAAVIINQQMLLIHKAERDTFWSLPGGRVELLEHSDETLVREMKEELDAQARVIRPLWYCENFFRYNGKKYHELATYYLTEFIGFEHVQPLTIFKGIEEDENLIYQWVPLTQLSQFDLKPSFLIDRVTSLPASLEYIKFKELEADER